MFSSINVNRAAVSNQALPEPWTARGCQGLRIVNRLRG